MIIKIKKSDDEEGQERILEALDAINHRLDNLDKRIANLESQVFATKNDFSWLASLYQSDRATISSEYVFKLGTETNKEKILICGYYGARNGGDELMLWFLLNTIPQNKDVTILLSRNERLDAAVYFPFKTIHYASKVDDCAALAREFDTIILGGGTTLDDTDYDNSGARNQLAYIELTVSRLALQVGKKVIVFGLSANKNLTNPRFIEELKTLVDGADYFSLRDKNSFNTFAKAGIDTKKIKLIDDLALGNTYETVKREQTEHVVGLVVVRYFENDDMLNALIEHTVEYYESKQQPTIIRLTTFFDNNDHDLHLFDETIKRYEGGGRSRVKLEITNTKLDVAGIASALDSCDTIVSMRYHATLIAGFALGKKVLCVNLGDTHAHYHNKNKYIKDNYLPGLTSINYQDINNKDKFFESLDEAERQTPKIDEKRLRSIRNRLRKLVRDKLA